MRGRQIGQPTDILSPDGKMEIYSFSLALAGLLPHRLIRLTTAGSFLSASKPFCMLHHFSWVLFLVAFIGEPQWKQIWTFFPPSSQLNLVFFFAINLFPAAHLFFQRFCHPAVLEVQQQAFFASVLHFCFIPPPQDPSAVLFSAVGIRTLVIPDIPRLQNTEIFFHQSSHISLCIYYKHATVVFTLRAGVWKNSTALPSKHIVDIYEMGGPVFFPRSRLQD